jgi:hypothetical protein
MGLFDFLKRGSSDKDTQKTPESIEHKIPETNSTATLSKAICPYCHAELEQMPMRKKKCPQCGNYIRVRKHVIGDKKVLMTESEANDVAFVTEELRGLEYYHITMDDYVKKLGEMAAEFGKEANPVDVLWRIYSDLNNEAIREGDIDTIRNMQFSMSKVLYHEGKDFIEPMREAKRLRLVKYRSGGAEKIRIVAADSCEACAKNNGRVLTIDEAFKTMPIPNPDCTTKIRDGPAGWCRCRYVVFFDDPELDTPQGVFEEQKLRNINKGTGLI